MVDIAQLARAPDCGSGGRRFEPDYPPHSTGAHGLPACPCFPENKAVHRPVILGCSLVVGQQTLTLRVLVRFQPSQPNLR